MPGGNTAATIARRRAAQRYGRSSLIGAGTLGAPAGQGARLLGS